MTLEVLDDFGQRVLLEPGALKCIPEELDELGATNVMVVASRSVARDTPVVTDLEAALGERRAATFVGIGAHTPAADVEDAVAKATACDADGFVSVGGGAVVDGVKHVIHGVSDELTPPIPAHVALPTTLSAAEFTHLAGITREGVKTGMADLRLIPDVAVLDPEATRHTPRWLWAATGIRAVDHAIESITTNETDDDQVERYCLEALAELVDALPGSVADADDLDAAADCQRATWKTSIGAIKAASAAGLSHKLGKALGATYGIQHGVTSALTLPGVLRYQAEVMPERIAPIAEALGADPDRPETAADAVDALIERLGIERKPLREHGVPKEDLPKAVEYATGGQDPDLVALLERIW